MTWCDPCHAEEKLVEGRTVPIQIDGTARLLEICPRHEQRLLVPLVALLEQFGVEPTGRTAEETDTPALVTMQSMPCPGCTKVFSARTNLLNHIRYSHGINTAAGLECPDCDMTFNNPMQTAAHRRNAHDYDPLEDSLRVLATQMSHPGAGVPVKRRVASQPSLLDGNDEPISNADKGVTDLHVCISCGKVLISRNAYVHHLKRDEGVELPVLKNCPDCGKKFDGDTRKTGAHRATSHGYKIVAGLEERLIEMMSGASRGKDHVRAVAS